MSILWIVGVGVYQRDDDLKTAGSAAGLSYDICVDQNSRRGTNENCSQEFDRVRAIWLAGSWGNVAIASLAPVPLAWLLMYTIVWVTRWVRRGFKENKART
jgi:hypothetical protein